MMGDFDVTVIGNMAIIENLALLEARLRLEAQAKLEEAGTVALEVANELVPVDTGYLKSSLYMETAPDHVTVGGDANYTLFVELGHRTRSGSHVPAQPFLIPGMAAGAEHLKSSLEGII
jgi:hypothetical protein